MKAIEPQYNTLQLYNSDGQQLERFVPHQSNQVKLYCCGPTVYGYAHIGNLRAYTVQDILRRCLLALGYQLNHVMNITDVGHLTDDDDYGEDKILVSARKKGKSAKDIAQYYTDAFFQDCAALNIAKPETICLASNHIADMQKFIAEIEAAGFTYYNNGNLYFDTGKLDDYGRLVCLVGLKHISEQELFSRTGPDSAKKNQRDFVLWFSNGKFSDQAMQWDSPWGRGYPGWHIECSAMARHFLGTQIDIHCGGVDHKTVHHPNEIAQSESIMQLGQKPWVRFWFHNEFVTMKNDKQDTDKKSKISKSNGNALTLQDLQDNGYKALDYRYFLLGSHYRSQVQFHFQALDGAQKSRKRLQQKAIELQEQCNKQISKNSVTPENSLKNAQINWEHCVKTVRKIQNGEMSKPYIQEFLTSLLQDLNTPQAIACLWNAIKDKKLSPQEKLTTLEFGEAFLQIGLFDNKETAEIPPQYLELLNQRDIARHDKNYLRADQIRTELQNMGYQIVDTAQGSTLKQS